VSADQSIVLPGKRYKVKSSEGAAVAGDWSATSSMRHWLPPGAIVVSAEVRGDAHGDTRVRINSPAGWLRADDLAPAEPAPSLKLDFEVFLRRHLTVAPGDHYGLEFPFTFDQLREFGPEFLTTAFRAAGTISEDNRVTEIVDVKPLSLRGASKNAFLSVAYAKPEAGLHTELFLKFPPDGDRYKYPLTVMSHGEVEMHRLSQTAELPVLLAKYYFGDYCSFTTNYILITGCIDFGVAPIEPAYSKGRDHQIPDIDEHYRVLTKALAALVAAHKTGAMGNDVENIFPFPRAARDFDPLAAPEPAIDRLIDFIGRIAPHLFVAEATTPEFLKQLRADLLFGLAHKDAVIAYLHRNIDYTGLCHPNLNVDNAWYWRDASGELKVGLLDWGGVGQMSIAQALSGMLMMPDPDMYIRLVQDVIATFVGEYAAQGGLSLAPDELRFQYKVAIFSTSIWIVLTVVMDALRNFTDDDYKAMKDRFDSRLQDSGLATAIIWIDNILREWLDGITPGDACRQIVAQQGELGGEGTNTATEDEI
jgi:hypothetical protein